MAQVTSNQLHRRPRIRVHFSVDSCFSIRRSHLPILLLARFSSRSWHFSIFHLLQTICDSHPLRSFLSTPHLRNPYLVSTTIRLSSSLPHRCLNLFISNEFTSHLPFSQRLHLSGINLSSSHLYYPPSNRSIISRDFDRDLIIVGIQSLSDPARLKEFWKSAD